MHRTHLLPSIPALAAGLVLVNASTAQVFQRLHGGAGLDEGRDVLALDDGGFLVTGRTTSAGPGTESLWVMRTDALGEPVWSSTYGGPFSEVGQRARAHPEGGFVVLGHTDNSWGGLRDLYLLRLTEAGTLQWSRRIGSSGNDDAGDLLVLPDGGYLICGNSGAFGNRRVLVARLDATGELVWWRQITSPGNDTGLGLALAPDNGCIVVGNTQGLGPGQTDIIAARFDATGNLLWVRTLGGGQTERALSVVPSGNGGWLIGGNTTSFGSGDQSILLVRITDEGEVVWSRAYGGERQDILRRLVPAHGGGHLIGGLLFETPGQAQDHGLLMHVDTAGVVLWSRTYGATGGFAEITGVARTAEGYVATGERSDADGNLDLLLLRTDANGVSGCDETEVAMTVDSVSLTVTAPTPATSTTGITSSEPPTQSDLGPLSLSTPCLDVGTAIATAAGLTAAAVHPNPAHDRLWIATEARGSTVRLLDARGAVVLEAPLNGRPVDISALPPGIYTGVVPAARAITTFRFVKE